MLHHDAAAAALFFPSLSVRPSVRVGIVRDIRIVRTTAAAAALFLPSVRAAACRTQAVTLVVNPVEAPETDLHTHTTIEARVVR
jgi:hypothetical protein